MFDDGTHVHTSCGNHTDDEYNNRHSHDDDDAHAHPTHEFSEGNCIVHHAATPSQLCPSGDGLQYYFIGADGSSQTGPYLPESVVRFARHSALQRQQSHDRQIGCHQLGDR